MVFINLIALFSLGMLLVGKAERPSTKEATARGEQRALEAGGKKKGAYASSHYNDAYYTPHFPHQDPPKNSISEPTQAPYDPYRFIGYNDKTSDMSYSDKPAGTCGGMGEDCCKDYKCKHPGLGCQVFTPDAVFKHHPTCQVCGGDNQPCCPNACKKDRNSGTCSLECNAGFLCNSQGTCKKCGSIGGQCCRPLPTSGGNSLVVPFSCEGNKCSILSSGGSQSFGIAGAFGGNGGAGGSVGGSINSSDNSQDGGNGGDTDIDESGNALSRGGGDVNLDISGPIFGMMDTGICESGAFCNNGVCEEKEEEECGAVGEPCCDGECDVGGECIAQKCVACGLAGLICCSGDTGPECIPFTGGCTDGLCGACGQPNQACCLGTLCADGAACVGGTCPSIGR